MRPSLAMPVLMRSAIKTASSSASLDIRASVGTSTSPTSTGTKAVTGVGFQPKVVLPFHVVADSSAAATESVLGLGCGVSSSSRASIAVSSRNAVTTSATHRRHTAAKALTYVYNAGVDLEADFSAFGSDGFTLDWSLVFGSAKILNHICLGGADLEVSLVQCQMNGTNAAQSFAHGLSGAPTGVLFLGATNNTAPANTSGFLLASIGAWATNQFSAAIWSTNGATTTNTSRRLATTGVYAYVDNSGVQRAMAVSSVDATNVNVTYPTTTSAYQSYFWMLCIRGAKCQVGTFDAYGGDTITCSGIIPKLFLPVLVPTGVTLAGTVNSILNLSIGASDGTNNVSCGITDNNGVTTTNARRFQSSNSLVQYDATGTKHFEATAAFSGESVVLTRSTNNQYYGEMGYLILGS